MTLTARRTATEPFVERRPVRHWSPAQVIALVLGAAAIVLGVIALARTGLDLSHLTRSHERVFGFGHTALLGLAELGFGFLLIVAALFPIMGRNIMTLVGAATLGLGIVVVSGWWSARMLSWLGAADRDGWLFVAAGGFVLLVSFFTPVFTWGGPRVVRRPAAPETETAAAEREGEPDVPAFVAGGRDTSAGERTEPASEPTRHEPGRREPADRAAPAEPSDRSPVDATRA